MSGVDNYEAKYMVKYTFQHSELKPSSVFERCENKLTKFQSNFLLLYELLRVDNYRYIPHRVMSFLGMATLAIFSKGIFYLSIKSRDSHANHLLIIWCWVVHAASHLKTFVPFVN